MKDASEIKEWIHNIRSLKKKNHVFSARYPAFLFFFMLYFPLMQPPSIYSQILQNLNLHEEHCLWALWLHKSTCRILKSPLCKMIICVSLNKTHMVVKGVTFFDVMSICFLSPRGRQDSRLQVHARLLLLLSVRMFAYALKEV